MAIVSPPRYQPPEDLNDIWLYHITSWQNLPGIILEEGLWSPNQLRARGITPLSGAHEHILKRRSTFPVKVGVGGTLHDYIPWSFAPRQPMLCALAHGQVDGQQVKQSEMVHLRTSVAAVLDAGLEWAFSDGHPTVFNSKLFDLVGAFCYVDWPLMKEQWWNNTDEDGDRTRRRQAEFLINDFAPWGLVTAIATMNEDVATNVREIVNDLPHAPRVKVVRKWYF
jgi:hypothetical protein